MIGMNRGAAQSLGALAPISRDPAKQHAASELRRAVPRRGQRRGQKAREQRRRQVRRPQPIERAGHYPAGIGGVAAVGFQLDIGAELELGQERHGFRKRRDPFPGELGGKPSAGVAPAKRGKRQPHRPAAAVGRARQPIVMQQDGLVIRGQANIELDPAAIEGLGPAQPGERIFRSAACGAAMSDYRRQNRRAGMAGGEKRDRQSAAFYGSGRRAPRSSPVC